jgi:formate hydrogenlyase subunit 3/multisubunit Na+/H+ antiporter MnhD subunit
MESKTPSIIFLVGIILGFITSISGLIEYFVLKSIGFKFFGNMEQFFQIVEFSLTWTLIASIIGIILSIICIFYLNRLKKSQSKNNYIALLVLGIIGMPLGMGIGGILVLIGGIMGITKTD